jgi:acyl carrier protein
MPGTPSGSTKRDSSLTPHQTLIKAFASALALPESPALESAEYRGIAQWDSVAHMRLVAEIEMAFDIMLDTEEVIGMSSFQKAKEILGKHDIDVS